MNDITVYPPIPEGFWAQIRHQLSRIINGRPSTFDEVRQVLLDPVYDEITYEVHRNGERHFDDDAAFFAGSGGDPSLIEALTEAGWVIADAEAEYYLSMRHSSTGETLTYIEGDVERGDHLSEEAADDNDEGTDPFDQSWGVVWQIDADAPSAAEAAARVWKETFQRGTTQPAADGACVFDVSRNGEVIQINLSDPEYAHLFDD